jgi:ubiquinone/menaquinone biosynthesis C-methylase UbiE
MRILDHFDFLAPFYEKFIQPKDPQDLWQLVNLPARGALLDAGGGTGRVAQFMIGKANPVVVADLSFRMLRETRKKNGLQPACSTTEYLPYADGTFNRIIMVDALHHVINQQATVDELWRTLQPGGRLVIEEPDVRNLAVKLIALGEKLLLMRSHFLDPRRMVKLFHFLDARMQVETGAYTVWVIADKLI